MIEMKKARAIRCFDYVNQPYERVRAALAVDAQGLFHRATTAATDRARSMAVELKAEVGPIAVGTDIDLEILDIAESERQPRAFSPVTTLALRWRAASSASLFPTMEAKLHLYPLTHSETQLELDGEYRVPLGLLGAAADALVGHRFAESTVQRFVRDIAEQLRTDLVRQQKAADEPPSNAVG
jgi:hypothetical protein